MDSRDLVDLRRRICTRRVIDTETAADIYSAAFPKIRPKIAPLAFRSSLRARGDRGSEEFLKRDSSFFGGRFAYRD